MRISDGVQTCALPIFTLHGRNGSVDWKLVGWLSAGSLPATVITLLLLRRLDSGPALDHLIQMVLAAAIILTASFTLLQEPIGRLLARGGLTVGDDALLRVQRPLTVVRSEEHTSELQSLMRNSYAVFCL